jgi:hypothetical protein
MELFPVSAATGFAIIFARIQTIRLKILRHSLERLTLTQVLRHLQRMMANPSLSALIKFCTHTHWRLSSYCKRHAVFVTSRWSLVNEGNSSRPKVRFLNTDSIFAPLHSYITIILRRGNYLERVRNKGGCCLFQQGNKPSDSTKRKQFTD